MKRLNWTRERTVLAAVAILFVASLVYLFVSDSGLLKVYTLSRENDSLGQEIASLKTENLALTQRIDDLQHNDRIIAAEIREQLGMIEPDETIFVFDVPANHTPES